MMLDTHPAAELFPLMDGEELDALADDIRENGQFETIKTLDGVVLDGRNRLRACEIAGVEPRLEPVDLGGADPVGYVVSLNVKRRNLRRDQLAIAAAEAWGMYAPGPGARTDLGADRAEVDRTRKRLAKMFGVGENAIQWARALVERAPEVAAAVKQNRAGLSDAYAALMELERAKSHGQDEAAEREGELRELRARLEQLGTRSVDVSLLPPPDPDALVAAMNVEETLRRTLQPSPGDVVPQADQGTLKAWDGVLAECDGVIARLVALPDLPESGDYDLVRLAALDVARRLGDATSRMVAKLPSETTSLRRIK